MYSKQRGVTLIGWLFLLVPIAILGYAGTAPRAGLPELHEGLALDEPAGLRDALR